MWKRKNTVATQWFKIKACVISVAFGCWSFIWLLQAMLTWEWMRWAECDEMAKHETEWNFLLYDTSSCCNEIHMTDKVQREYTYIVHKICEETWVECWNMMVTPWISPLVVKFTMLEMNKTHWTFQMSTEENILIKLRLNRVVEQNQVEDETVAPNGLALSWMRTTRMFLIANRTL